jgi:hypothetical protein
MFAQCIGDWRNSAFDTPHSALRDKAQHSANKDLGFDRFSAVFFSISMNVGDSLSQAHKGQKDALDNC